MKEDEFCCRVWFPNPESSRASVSVLLNQLVCVRSLFPAFLLFVISPDFLLSFSRCFAELFVQSLSHHFRVAGHGFVQLSFEFVLLPSPGCLVFCLSLLLVGWFSIESWSVLCVRLCQVWYVCYTISCFCRVVQSSPRVYSLLCWDFVQFTLFRHH